MERSIIKITPVEDVFSITWNLHKRCNNDCMYCGDFLHDSTSPVRSLKEMQDHWTQIFEKTKHAGLPYNIAFTGGEPVINKDFKPLIDWLINEYGSKIKNIGVTSNGTASKNYYLNLLDKVSFLTLSSHTESFDLDKFTDTIIACNLHAQSYTNKFFMVNIMEEYWAVDIIKQLIDICKVNNIRFSINKINYNRSGTSEYPVFVINKTLHPRPDLTKSPDVIKKAHTEIQNYANLHSIPEDEYYNVIVEYDDASTIKTYATRLNFLGLNNFKNWNCYAGLRRISVASDTTVYSAECYNQTLGKLSDNSFKLLESSSICHQEKCTGNPADIMINKNIPGL